MDGWGKIRAAAKYAGVSERTMRDWLKQGLKHSRLPSGSILIRFSDIDAYLEGFAVSADDGKQINQIIDEVMASMSVSHAGNRHLLNIKELADELRVPKSWIYSRTRTGEIPHHKIGRYCRFDLNEVREWIKKTNRRHKLP